MVENWARWKKENLQDSEGEGTLTRINLKTYLTRHFKVSLLQTKGKTNGEGT